MKILKIKGFVNCFLFYFQILLVQKKYLGLEELFEEFLHTEYGCSKNTPFGTEG